MYYDVAVTLILAPRYRSFFLLPLNSQLSALNSQPVSPSHRRSRVCSPFETTSLIATTRQSSLIIQGASTSTMEAKIDEWFKAFYATSDDGSAHQKYTTFFAQDAIMIMGDQKALGQAGIHSFLSPKLMFAFSS